MDGIIAFQPRQGRHSGPDVSPGYELDKKPVPAGTASVVTQSLKALHEAFHFNRLQLGNGRFPGCAERFTEAILARQKGLEKAFLWYNFNSSKTTLSIRNFNNLKCFARRSSRALGLSDFSVCCGCVGTFTVRN